MGTMLDNYPPGVYDWTPNAPWNDSFTPPEHDFEVTISQTLSKNIVVTTDDYIYEEDSDEGWHDYDTTDTDWEKAYSNNHYTPIELIKLFKQHLETDLTRYGNTVDKKRIKHLIEECNNWCEDECEIIKD